MSWPGSGVEQITDKIILDRDTLGIAKTLINGFDKVRLFPGQVRFHNDYVHGNINAMPKLTALSCTSSTNGRSLLWYSWTPPAYDPHLVARAIAHACVTPVRDVTIGGAGGISLVLGNLLAPRVIDWLSARVGHASMTTMNPGDQAQRDNLYEPREDLAVNSSLRPMTRKTSLALEAQLNPHLALAALAGIGAFLVAAGPRSGRARR